MRTAREPTQLAALAELLDEQAGRYRDLNGAGSWRRDGDDLDVGLGDE